jgi:hypothetical protein
VVFDLIAVPHGFSLKEPVTEQYVANFYGIPQDLKYDIPPSVRAAENNLVDSFQMEHPNDIITSDAFLMGYQYRNDSTTEGYAWKSIPVYAIFVSRTYQTLKLSGLAVLGWTVILNVLIAFAVTVPETSNETLARAAFHKYERTSAGSSEFPYDRYESKEIPFIPSNGFTTIMWKKDEVQET